MSHCLRILLSGFFVLLLPDLYAQQSLPDSTAAAMAKTATLGSYTSYMGIQAPLFNGKAYQAHLPLQGTPYFLDDSLEYGTILYDGVLYREIPMFYDLIYGQPVVLNGWGGMLAPVPERISQFTIAGHDFIRDKDDFYDQLVTGKVRLLAHRAKVVTENIVQQELLRDVSERDHYFLVKDGVYHQVGNLNSLLSILKDKKKDILLYIGQQKIRRRKDAERAMIAAVQFYNQSLPH
jgi:hypothetical protein